MVRHIIFKWNTIVLNWKNTSLSRQRYENIRYKLILKLVFLTLLTFEKQLNTHTKKLISTNKKPCLVRFTFLLNPDELCYYPFIFKYI